MFITMAPGNEVESGAGRGADQPEGADSAPRVSGSLLYQHGGRPHQESDPASGLGKTNISLIQICVLLASYSLSKLRK